MKIVILEKDIHCLDRLTKLLQESFRRIHALRHANTIKRGIELIKEVQPDIVFTCFSLKDGDACTALKKVSHLRFRIFFTVGLGEPLHPSSEHLALSSLSAPGNNKKTRSSSPTGLNPKILLPTGGVHIAVKTDDIIKCVAEGNYTLFYLKDKKYLVTNPIKYYDSLFQDHGFFRINRSVLVNVGHITAIYKKETIVLTNNEKIMVSRRNKDNLKRLIDHLS